MGRLPQPVGLELATVQTAPTIARLHTRGVLESWHVPGAQIEDVQLVVSELVTNAIRHACPDNTRPTYGDLANVERLLLTLRPASAGVVVEVFDTNPKEPTFSHTGIEAESGRGLLIVTAYSCGWGTKPILQSDHKIGKVVWANIACQTIWRGDIR